MFILHEKHQWVGASKASDTKSCIPVVRDGMRPCSPATIQREVTFGTVEGLVMGNFFCIQHSHSCAKSFHVYYMLQEQTLVAGTFLRDLELMMNEIYIPALSKGRLASDFWDFDPKALKASVRHLGLEDMSVTNVISFTMIAKTACFCQSLFG